MAAVLLLLAGCASRADLSSLSDDRFDFTTIRKVAVVLEDKRGRNPLFGDIFMESAAEKIGPLLLQGEYVLRENIAGTDLGERVDAFLELTVRYSNEGFLTYGFPTTFGASAKLVETATGNTVWEKDYAYRSAASGHAAPPIHEAMKLAADTILDSIPLIKKGAPPMEEEAAPQQKALSVETPAAAGSPPVESRQTMEKPPAPQVRIAEKETAPPPDGQAMIFSVQAGAFLQKDNAAKMISLLERKGFSPYISEKVDSRKRVWHTVQVGQYATRSEAETAAKDISDKAGIATTLHLLK